MAISVKLQFGVMWVCDADPTIAPGVSAPPWQFLVRTDVAKLYYKSGPLATDWTSLSGAGGGGATGKAQILVLNTNDGGAFTNHNDVDLPALGAVNGPPWFLEINQLGSAAGQFTGFKGGVDGQILFITIGPSSNSAAIVPQSAASLPANRMQSYDTANPSLGKNTGWVYDGSVSRWRQLSTTLSG